MRWILTPPGYLRKMGPGEPQLYKTVTHVTEADFL